MISSNVDELKRIKKKIVKIQVLGLPGWVFIGLGLFGLYGSPTSSNTFLSLLGDKNIALALLVLGVVIGLLEAFLLIPLFRKKTKVENEHVT